MLRLTLEGNIILTVGTHSEVSRQYADGKDQKKSLLDELHKRKIDLADEIFVINVTGYVGKSTKSEIKYAIETGKDVRFLEPIK